jgi:hypothetical protein
MRCRARAFLRFGALLAQALASASTEPWWLFVGPQNLFWTARALGIKRQDATLAELRAAGEAFCGTPWSVLRSAFPGLAGVEDRFVARYCFGAAYSVGLLASRLRLPNDTRMLRFTNSLPLTAAAMAASGSVAPIADPRAESGGVHAPGSKDDTDASGPVRTPSFSRRSSPGGGVSEVSSRPPPEVGISWVLGAVLVHILSGAAAGASASNDALDSSGSSSNKGSGGGGVVLPNPLLFLPVAVARGDIHAASTLLNPSTHQLGAGDLAAIYMHGRGAVPLVALTLLLILLAVLFLKNRRGRVRAGLQAWRLWRPGAAPAVMPLTRVLQGD